MWCVSYKQPAIQNGRSNSDKESAVIAKNNLKLVFRKENWLPLGIVRNGLSHVDPQFHTSLPLSLS